MRSQGAGAENDRLVERAGELCDAAVATAREVLIVSPWLSYEPIVRLLAALPATASLRVVFRWPATPQDLWVLSRRGLEVLFEASKLRNVTVSFVTQGPLHAKVFVFDRRVAYVGSANFTGGGLGRNLELGLRADAARVAAWVDGLPTVPLDDESWGEIQRRFDTVPEPPSPVEGWEKGSTGPARRTSSRLRSSCATYAGRAR